MISRFIPRTALVAALALSGCGAPPADAQSQPTAAAQIPLFQGLRPTEVDTTVSPDDDMRDGWGNPVPMVAQRTTRYSVAAHPEAVYDFYLARLGGQEEWDQEDVDPLRRGKGEFTRTTRTRHLHDTAEDDRSGEHPVTAAQKQRVLAARPRDAAGEWFSDGSFEWSYRDQRGDIVQLVVVVRDEGISGNWAAYAPNTVVEISEARYRPRAED